MTSKHTHAERNEVTLVWGSLTLAPIIITCSFTGFALSATSPSFTYVSNQVPESSQCRAAAPQLRLLQLLLPDCIHLCPLLHLRLLQLLFATCIRFSCCSTIASASTAAPRLCPFKLLLPDCVRFNCCLPNCVMHPLAAPAGFQPMPAPGPNVFEHSSRSSRFSKLKHKGRASLV